MCLSVKFAKNLSAASTGHPNMRCHDLCLRCWVVGRAGTGYVLKPEFSAICV